MDLSSLPEAQQQQLQQLQLQFQEHQRQRQQQQEQEAQFQLQQQQQQQQQVIQDYASQSYDPSQFQSYDQSYYSYYQYQQESQQQQQQQSINPQQSQLDDQQQQHYAYYQSDYGNAYQEHQQYSQTESASASASVHPPGVSMQYEAQPQIVEPPQGAQSVSRPGEGQVQVQVQHQQNAYYPPQQVVLAAPPAAATDQQNSEYQAPPGLNPAAAAAVAALSQLTQFAGTMDVAERAMAGLQGRQWHGTNGGYDPMMDMGPGTGPLMGHGSLHLGSEPMQPPVGRFPFTGGSRRGSRPFRGGRPSNIGNCPPRSGGAMLPSRGRGRGHGRGGPRNIPPDGASSSSRLEASADEAAETTEEEAETSADNQKEESQAAVPAQTSGPVQGNIVPKLRPRGEWCELCRVECTSLEVLEQHKNGKRHKKNMLKLEGLQKLEGLRSASNPVAESVDQQKPVDDPNSKVALPLKDVQEAEQNKITVSENIPSVAANGENGVDNDQQNDLAEQPEVPEDEQSNVQTMKPSMSLGNSQTRGTKRKMRGGRGGKRMKTSDMPRKVVEPPKPKVVIPVVCDLCNVKCDTQEVFNKHLSGKKHISKVRRFEGHQAMYGVMGLQALYPPNPIGQALFPQVSQQAYYGPQVSYPPPAVYMPPQPHLSTPGGSGFQHFHEPLVSNVNREFGFGEAAPNTQQ